MKSDFQNQNKTKIAIVPFFIDTLYVTITPDHTFLVCVICQDHSTIFIPIFLWKSTHMLFEFYIPIQCWGYFDSCVIKGCEGLAGLQIRTKITPDTVFLRFVGFSLERGENRLY